MPTPWPRPVIGDVFKEGARARQGRVEVEVNDGTGGAVGTCRQAADDLKGQPVAIELRRDPPQSRADGGVVGEWPRRPIFA